MLGAHCSCTCFFLYFSFNLLKSMEQLILGLLMCLNEFSVSKRLVSSAKWCTVENSTVLFKSLKKINRLYGPFLLMGFNCIKARATLKRQYTFYHKACKNSWYSFYQPWKDERLSWPWSQTVVLNMGPLDWESSALTTRPLPQSFKLFKNFLKIIAPAYINQLFKFGD